MRENVVKRVQWLETRVAAAQSKAARLKGELSKKVDETIQQGRRAARSGYRTAETIIEDATSSVKRHPWRAVGLAFGIGALIGLVVPLRRRS